ncbi:hypothetical protein [Streptomyces sp. NPDC018031]|uniref:hypothetical protein n=1 Tax=Streptomyces sp. NPDC018031 TaxID=3365033 RepID=UPI0037895B4B
MIAPGGDLDQLFRFWQRTGTEDGASMRVGRIRRRCKRLIDELGLPASTDLHGLSETVARRTGRPVRLVPMSLGGVVSGMTAVTDEEFWVFYESRTSPWHQIHIVLHELGHLLLGHDQDPAVTEEALRLWAPSMDVATAMRRMGLAPGFARHHCYDRLTERETEVLGTLLMERVVPTAPDDGPPLCGRAAELAAALGPALRHDRRTEVAGATGGPSGADGPRGAGDTPAGEIRDGSGTGDGPGGGADTGDGPGDGADTGGGREGADTGGGRDGAGPGDGAGTGGGLGGGADTEDDPGNGSGTGGGLGGGGRV